MDIFLTSVWGTESSVQLAKAAEDSGSGGVWLAEHHGSAYGRCDDALALAASILDSTERIQVGTAAVPFWRHTPAGLAELVRRLPSQRFTLGVARGSYPEAAAHGCPPEHYATGFAPWLRELRHQLSRRPNSFPAGDRPTGDKDPSHRVQVMSAPDDLTERHRAQGASAHEDLPGHHRAQGASTPEDLPGHQRVLVAAASQETIGLAASQHMPLLLGVENDDAGVAEKLRWWGSGGDHVRLVLPSTVDFPWLLDWQGRKLPDPTAYVARLLKINTFHWVPRKMLMIEATGSVAAAIRLMRP